jgi:hypothetical protein
MAKEAGEKEREMGNEEGYLYPWGESESEDESKGERCKCYKLDEAGIAAYIYRTDENR